jgi:hypothetical protein
MCSAYHLGGLVSSTIFAIEPSVPHLAMDYTEWCHRRQRLLVLATVLISFIAISNADAHLFNIPYHTLALTGLAWVNELLESPNSHRLEDNLGVNSSTFLGLLENLVRSTGFHDDRDMLVEEKLAIFLWWARTNMPYVHIAECFQRSQSTISS